MKTIAHMHENIRPAGLDRRKEGITVSAINGRYGWGGGLILSSEEYEH